MHQRDAIEAISEQRGGAAIVTGPGYSSGLLYALGHEPATIYNMELGYAAPVCLGVALAAPDQQVIAIEGDGSMIAGMAVFSTIARYLPENLTVVVIDNGAYRTIGDGSFVSATRTGMDLAAVAKACGIPADHVVVTNDRNTLSSAVQKALAESGPYVVIATIDSVDPDEVRSIPGHDLVESALGFRRAMVESGHGPA